MEKMRVAFLSLCIVLMALASGCRKKDVVPAEVQWRKDVDAAYADAARQKKRVIVFFGAEWQMATVELEKKTFPSPRVRRVLEDFVPIYVDVTDTDDPNAIKQQERFHVIGLPTVIVFDLDQKTELVRILSFVDDETLARALEDAKRGIRYAPKRPN
jgi:thiol:disulfide interchange protein